jgi:hypothetical protein
VGVTAAHKQAAVKNGILAHRDGVHGTIKEKSATEEDFNIHGEIELPVGKRIGVTALTTSLIATADLLATNYWANIRLAAQLDVMPVFNNVYDRFRFMWVTGSSRYMSLTVGAAGVIGGSLLLKDPLERQFPIAQYGYFGAILTGVIPGIVAGPVGNMWDVIRVNQMKSFDKATMKVPSMWSVAKNLYMSNGYSVFLRGSVVNAIYAMTVYSTIAVVDQWVNNSLFAGKKSPEVARRMSESHERIEPIQAQQIQASMPKSMPVVGEKESQKAESQQLRRS